VINSLSANHAYFNFKRLPHVNKPKVNQAGMCSRTTWSRPKARDLRGQGQSQGHKILTSRCPRGRGQSARTPIPALFTVWCYAESGYATSSVCPSLSNSTPYCRLLCACVWSIVFVV